KGGSSRGTGGSARRFGSSDRRGRQVNSAPPGDPAAPGVLLLRLQRSRRVLADPASTPQENVAGRLDQHLLRTPRSGRAGGGSDHATSARGTRPDRAHLAAGASPV